MRANCKMSRLDGGRLFTNRSEAQTKKLFVWNALETWFRTYSPEKSYYFTKSVHYKIYKSMKENRGKLAFSFFFSLSSNCFVLSVCEGAGKQTHLFTFIIFPFDSPRFSQPHLSIPLFWIGVFLTDVLWTVLFTLLYKSLLLNWSCYYFYCSCTVVVL